MTSIKGGRPGYEIAADCVVVHDSRGFPHYLGRSQPLPDWVPNDRLAELIGAGALDVFEEI